jgi:hypothetical protein
MGFALTGDGGIKSVVNSLQPFSGDIMITGHYPGQAARRRPGAIAIPALHHLGTDYLLEIHLAGSVHPVNKRIYNRGAFIKSAVKAQVAPFPINAFPALEPIRFLQRLGQGFCQNSGY